MLGERNDYMLNDEFEKRKKTVTDYNYFTDKPDPNNDWGLLPHFGISLVVLTIVYWIVTRFVK